MNDKAPLFTSFEDFEHRMDEAELTPESCTYRAAVHSLHHGNGFSITSEDSVRSELLEFGNEPLEVVVSDTKQSFTRNASAEIMCAACGMCVRVVGGFTDSQRVDLGPEDRECPVFKQQ